MSNNQRKKFRTAAEVAKEEEETVYEREEVVGPATDLEIFKKVYNLDERALYYEVPVFPILRMEDDKWYTLVFISSAKIRVNKFGQEQVFYDVYCLDDSNVYTLIVTHRHLARQLAKLHLDYGLKTLKGVKMCLKRVPRVVVTKSGEKKVYRYFIRDVTILKKNEFEEILRRVGLL